MPLQNVKSRIEVNIECCEWPEQRCRIFSHQLLYSYFVFIYNTLLFLIFQLYELIHIL